MVLAPDAEHEVLGLRGHRGEKLKTRDGQDGEHKADNGAFLHDRRIALRLSTVNWGRDIAFAMTPPRTLFVGLCVAALLVAFGVRSSAQVAVPRPPIRTDNSRIPVITPELSRPAPAQGAFVKDVRSATVAGSAALVVAQLSLEPGSYQIIGKGVLIDDSQVDMAVACALHTGKWDPETSDGLDYASLTLAPASRVPLTLVGSYANTTLGNVTVAMSCRASEGAMASVRWIKLSAVAVPSITTR